MIEQGDYPYVGLLGGARQSTGKDLPLLAEDRYSCRSDTGTARRIRMLEKTLDDSPDDIDVLLSLARLNVITGRRPTHVQPLLKRLRELARTTRKSTAMPPYTMSTHTFSTRRR